MTQMTAQKGTRLHNLLMKAFSEAISEKKEASSITLKDCYVTDCKQQADYPDFDNFMLLVRQVESSEGRKLESILRQFHDIAKMVKNTEPNDSINEMVQQMDKIGQSVLWYITNGKEGIG